eukprot:144936-Hanusia_phi.AAC.3
MKGVRPGPTELSVDGPLAYGLLRSGVGLQRLKTLDVSGAVYTWGDLNDVISINGGSLDEIKVGDRFGGRAGSGIAISAVKWQGLSGASLGTCRVLKRLELHNVADVYGLGSFMQFLRGTTSLEELSLSYTDFSRSNSQLNEFWRFAGPCLRKQKSVTKVRLGWCCVSNLWFMAALINVRVLDFGGTSLAMFGGDVIAEGFGRLRNIRVLKLQRCDMDTQQIFNVIGSLVRKESQIEHLDLSMNQRSGRLGSEDMGFWFFRALHVALQRLEKLEFLGMHFIDTRFGRTIGCQKLIEQLEREKFNFPGRVSNLKQLRLSYNGMNESTRERLRGLVGFAVMMDV